MADAEELACHLGEARAERQVVAVERTRDHVRAVDAFRDHDRRDRVGVPLRGDRAQLEFPAVDHGGAGSAGEIGVALKDILQALLGEHRERFAQSVKHGQGGCVGEISRRVGLHHVGVIEVAARRIRLLGRLERLLADTSDAKAGRQHQSLLRPADAHVHPPLIHPEVDARQRAHRVHEQKGGMLRAVHCLAHRGHIAGDARRGLVLANQHRLDLVLLVRGERGKVALDRRTLSPGSFQDLHVETEALAHVDPQVAELAEPRCQHLVAGVQAIGQSGFPAAGTGGGKNERSAAAGLEYRLQPRKAGPGELGEDRRPVIFHGNHHGTQHAVRNIGGAGDEQEITTSHVKTPRRLGLWESMDILPAAAPDARLN